VPVSWHWVGWTCFGLSCLLAGTEIPGGGGRGRLLGGSGGVVNSLDFCLASLKSLGCFYFRCVLSSQWKAVTENLWILHCQLYGHFWRPVVKMCLATSSNLLLVLWDAPKRIFSTNSCSSGQPKHDPKTLFSTTHPLSPVFFATAKVLAFVLLRNSRFSFHCYTQREATPAQKSARKWLRDLSRLLAWKITKLGHSLHWNAQYRSALTHIHTAYAEAITRGGRVMSL